MSNKQSLTVVQKRLTKFVNRDVPKARVTATNKALAKAKTQAVKVVAASTKVKVGAIRKRVYISRANRNKAAAFHFYRRPIAMISLNAKQTKRGVRAGKYFMASAFIADGSKRTGRGGLRSRQVMRRKSGTRYPVEVLSIPISKQVNELAPKTVKRTLIDNFPRLYDHEIKRLAARV